MDKISRLQTKQQQNFCNSVTDSSHVFDQHLTSKFQCLWTLTGVNHTTTMGHDPPARLSLLLSSSRPALSMLRCLPLIAALILTAFWQTQVLSELIRLRLAARLICSDLGVACLTCKHPSGHATLVLICLFFLLWFLDSLQTAASLRTSQSGCSLQTNADYLVNTNQKRLYCERNLI